MKNFEELLSLTDNQIIINLDDILTIDKKDNNGNNNLEISNCFEGAHGFFGGCYSPGKEQGISEHLINM